MGRTTIDLHARLNAMAATDPPINATTMETCWQWTGRTINTNGGRTTADGSAHLRKTPVRPTEDTGYIRHHIPNKHQYKSAQPVSYLGEMVSPSQALYHYFRFDEFGTDLYYPTPAERSHYKRDLALNGPDHRPLWGKHLAQPSLLRGLRVNKAALCGNCFNVPTQQGGIYCVNPFHATATWSPFNRDPNPSGPDPDRYTTATEAPMEAAELADLISRWVRSPSARAVPPEGRLEAFLAIYGPDSDPATLQAAIEAARLPPEWSTVLVRNNFGQDLILS